MKSLLIHISIMTSYRQKHQHRTYKKKLISITKITALNQRTKGNHFLEGNKKIQNLQ